MRLRRADAQQDDEFRFRPAPSTKVGLEMPQPIFALRQEIVHSPQHGPGMAYVR